MTMLTKALAALAGIGAFATFVLAYAGGPSLLLIVFDAGLATVFTVTFTRAVTTTSAQPPEVYAAYEEGLRDGSKPGRRDLHMPVGGPGGEGQKKGRGGWEGKREQISVWKTLR
ncbi:hypothetical protein, partial [Nonomuraea angiospora]